MEKEGIVKSPVNSLAEINPLVRYMQDRIASNAMFGGVAELKKEEILEAIKAMEGENLNPVVEYAEVRCTEMEAGGAGFSQKQFSYCRCAKWSSRLDNR